MSGSFDLKRSAASTAPAPARRDLGLGELTVIPATVGGRPPDRVNQPLTGCEEPVNPGGRDRSGRRARTPVASSRMTVEQLRDRVREALIGLNLNHGWSADEWVIVVEGENDRVLYVTFEEVDDTAGRKWPAICLAVPILEGVDATALPAGMLETNHALVVGKIGLRNGRLSVEHEIMGWPGQAEFGATLEILLNHHAALAVRLEGIVAGSPPPPYSERAADAIARAQAT